jgi:hypothetical protein
LSQANARSFISIHNVSAKPRNRKIHGSVIVAYPDFEIGDTLTEAQPVEELYAHGDQFGIENSTPAE